MRSADLKAEKHLQARHDAGEGNEEAVGGESMMSKWRQKERLKTTAVALVLCLNIGVDPPDVMKISPCARLECWVDPLSMQPPKALDTIGAPPPGGRLTHHMHHEGLKVSHAALLMTVRKTYRLGGGG